MHVKVPEQHMLGAIHTSRGRGIDPRLLASDDGCLGQAIAGDGTGAWG